MGDRLEDEDWVAQDDNEAESVKADWEEDSDAGDGDRDRERDRESDEDEVESVAAWKEEAAKEAKKLKKQAKFAALKEKKKRPALVKRESEGEAEGESNSDGEGEGEGVNTETATTPSEVQSHTLSQFSAQEMLKELSVNAPVPYRTFQQLSQSPFFVESDFFFPALQQSAATESTTKAPCPFIRALSVCFPNYRKALLNTENIGEKRGCPVMVIITASATRATEVIKSISSKLIKVKIGKLFAKHFKLSEQIEMLSSSYFPIVIGTPNRIEKLIELGALSLKDTKVILVDFTPDTKQFTTLTLPDVKSDFYKLFYDYVHPEKSHIKLALIKDSSSEQGNSKKTPHAKLQKKRGYGKLDNSQRKGFNTTIDAKKKKVEPEANDKKQKL